MNTFLLSVTILISILAITGLIVYAIKNKSNDGALVIPIGLFFFIIVVCLLFLVNVLE